MLTRAKISHSKPKVFLENSEPITVKQALASLEGLNAMKTKFNSLLKIGTRDLTSLQPHMKSIGRKCVYKVMEDPDGSINKHKARVVAKGFHQ